MIYLSRVYRIPHESKPWNPIIASVFYRAGIIEKWGTGTLNILNSCIKNGNPLPVWKIRDHCVVTSFYSHASRSAESRPESIEAKILLLLRDGPLSKSEITKRLGHSQISGSIKKAIAKLLEQKKIAHTLPEKPQSWLQKYRTKERNE